ncbi:MAG: hypothetical protein GXC72_01205 [Chitinophagaceae bacterium]|jgi:hypothetical protein|nr:hypothetical protein [Chitinophagaceae bacterium]
MHPEYPLLKRKLWKLGFFVTSAILILLWSLFTAFQVPVREQRHAAIVKERSGLQKHTTTSLPKLPKARRCANCVRGQEKKITDPLDMERRAACRREQIWKS